MDGWREGGREKGREARTESRTCARTHTHSGRERGEGCESLKYWPLDPTYLKQTHKHARTHSASAHTHVTSNSPGPQASAVRRGQNLTEGGERTRRTS